LAEFQALERRDPAVRFPPREVAGVERVEPRDPVRVVDPEEPRPAPFGPGTLLSGEAGAAGDADDDGPGPGCDGAGLSKGTAQPSPIATSAHRSETSCSPGRYSRARASVNSQCLKALTTLIRGIALVQD